MLWFETSLIWILNCTHKKTNFKSSNKINQINQIYQISPRNTFLQQTISTKIQTK